MQIDYNGEAPGGQKHHQIARKIETCQRSFNRQSTAFVMRGLWVRLPPLAFG